MVFMAYKGRSSTVPAQGRFRRQIGTESCYRVGSVGISAQCLIVITFLVET